MTPEEMKQRTKAFGLRCIRLSQSLPGGDDGRVIGRQLLRAGTSVGANYRAACRARSTPDSVAKLKLVEEEADESAYWLEIVIDSGMLKSALVRPLLEEAEEILAIVVASIRTARGLGRSSPGDGDTQDPGGTGAPAEPPNGRIVNRKS